MAGSTTSEATISPETFAAGLNTRVLHCRELGHNWKPWTASYDPKARAYDRRLRCASCKTQRVQVLDSSGHPVSNRYVYPEGYLAQNVDGVGLSALRDVFRLEAVTRFLDGSQQQLKAV